MDPEEPMEGANGDAAPGAPAPAQPNLHVLYDQGGPTNLVEAWHSRQIIVAGNNVGNGGDDHPLPELVDLDQPQLQGTHFGFVIFFISMLILTDLVLHFFLFEYCKTL